MTTHNMPTEVEVITTDDDGTVIGVALTVEDCDAWFAVYDPGYERHTHVTRSIISIETLPASTTGSEQP